MTGPGYLHLGLMIFALTIGAAILGLRKGTRAHRVRGRVFVTAMVVSNLLVLGIYEDSQRMAVFHYLALVSLMSLVAAVMLVRIGPPSTRRRIVHGHVMLWTYGGMVAAGLGQGASFLGMTPWPMIALTFLCVGLYARRLDFAAMLTPLGR